MLTTLDIMASFLSQGEILCLSLESRNKWMVNAYNSNISLYKMTSTVKGTFIERWQISNQCKAIRKETFNGVMRSGGGLRYFICICLTVTFIQIDLLLETRSQLRIHSRLQLRQSYGLAILTILKRFTNSNDEHYKPAVLIHTDMLCLLLPLQE